MDYLWCKLGFLFVDLDITKVDLGAIIESARSGISSSQVALIFDKCINDVLSIFYFNYIGFDLL